MQSGHLNRDFKALWHYASQCLCTAVCWEERPHTQKSETEHVRKGGTVLIGRGQIPWSPRCKGEGWAARADCASAKGLTFRLSSSPLNMCMVFQPNTWTSQLPELVWPSAERPVLGCWCHVTGVLHRTRPADLRPHADFVQNSLQTTKLHYWALILFSLIISSCFSLQY